MTKPELLRALQAEIHRHTFDYYVENPPAMAQGGKGVVVPGFPPWIRVSRSKDQSVEGVFREDLRARASAKSRGL